MKSPEASSVRVPIDVLPRVAAALAAIPPPSLIAEVEAECLSCGMRISGAELTDLGRAEVVGEKLDRVRLGYCARKTCESRFYEIKIPATAPAARAAIEGIDQLAPATQERPRAPSASRQLSLKWIVAGGIGLYLVFLFHHWYYGERIPLFQEQHHYTANPNPSE